MPQKLTIPIGAEVCDGLNSGIGRDLSAGYAAMAADEAREAEAEAWSEGLGASDPTVGALSREDTEAVARAVRVQLDL